MVEPKRIQCTLWKNYHLFRLLSLHFVDLQTIVNLDFGCNLKNEIEFDAQHNSPHENANKDKHFYVYGSDAMCMHQCGVSDTSIIFIDRYVIMEILAINTMQQINSDPRNLSIRSARLLAAAFSRTVLKIYSFYS